MPTSKSPEFSQLQTELNTIEKNLTVPQYKKHSEKPTEAVSQRLDAIMKKIDELTHTETQKLAEQEIELLKNKIERIRMLLEMAINNELLSMKNQVQSPKKTYQKKVEADFETFLKNNNEMPL
ncbi:MAG: hypothetical protein LBG52_04035 [Candidatus Peribacteria bacterium]|jgi:hypothetical protein|nr:hypothetical protein [Candidatus Peribacteria bacterium]